MSDIGDPGFDNKAPKDREYDLRSGCAKAARAADQVGQTVGGKDRPPFNHTVLDNIVSLVMFKGEEG